MASRAEMESRAVGVRLAVNGKDEEGLIVKAWQGWRDILAMEKQKTNRLDGQVRIWLIQDCR